jgi:hypothetical protein
MTDRPLNSSGFYQDDWAPEQRTIIELDETAQFLVEAGPGTGKTAVACARVAYLIEECGLGAANILLVSFTRAAVKELRDRIESFAEEPVNVAGLKIVTLDSFTWQVVRGIGDRDSSELLGGYDGNIENFLHMLRAQDSDLFDYISEIEHVVMDEGQDLVGIRADLAVEIIGSLHEECGVTVFADSAQAIYGFTNDNEKKNTHSSKTAVERIFAGEIDGFDSCKLDQIHRTDDPNLIKLFSEGRERLMGKHEGDVDSWLQMKNLISDCAHGRVGGVVDQGLDGCSDHLVLYRSRAEVLMASSFLWRNQINHKLRMSRIPQRVHPWIARLLGEYTDDLLTKNQFQDLWDFKIDSLRSPERINADSCWELLLQNVGDSSGRVRLSKLREILSRDRPPIDFLVDERELEGPVLGTIHGSKGREADHVNLMLPLDDFMDRGPEIELKPEEMIEEERVLFVGSTRARQRLMVGSGMRTYATSLESGRVFRSQKRQCIQVEIGLRGDLNLVSFADGKTSRDEVVGLQDWFWDMSTNKCDLIAVHDPNNRYNSYELCAADKSYRIGYLSKSVSNQLVDIGRRFAKGKGLDRMIPPQEIQNIHMVGATTTVLPEAQRDSLQLPWRQSGFILTPIITAFSYVDFEV